MIKKSKPLSMAESMKYLDKKEDTEVIGFIKKFTKLKPKEAEEMGKKLEDLNIIQLREEQIVNIIDIMPESNDELNKILVGVSLSEDETKNVLDTIKEFK